MNNPCLILKGTDLDILFPPPGERVEYRVVDNEFVVDYITARFILKHMDVDIQAKFDFQNKTINVFIN